MAEGRLLEGFQQCARRRLVIIAIEAAHEVLDHLAGGLPRLLLGHDGGSHGKTQLHGKAGGDRGKKTVNRSQPEPGQSPQNFAQDLGKIDRVFWWRIELRHKFLSQPAILRQI